MTPLNTDSDGLLFQLLTEGNEQAFEAIYKKHVVGLFRFANKNVPSTEDCEEIVQEVFESLWKRREALGNVESISAYLFTMVKYRVIRYFRHQRVKKRYAEHFRLFEAVYETFSIEEKNSLSIQENILKAMEQLPQRCQQAVRLRLIENLTNEDIAQRMNIKKDTVENYMVTAVNYLRQQMGALYKANG